MLHTRVYGGCRVMDTLALVPVTVSWGLHCFVCIEVQRGAGVIALNICMMPAIVYMHCVLYVIQRSG